MIKKIRHMAFWEGRETPHYFHPSVCSCNDGLLMLMQTFGGVSDTYGELMWSLSKDLGTSWSMPRIIPALRHNKLAGGVIEGIADVRPLFHPPSNAVIAMGCNTYYGNKGYWKYDSALKNEVFRQLPVYAVRHVDGSWSERKELNSAVFEGCLNWRIACAQMLVLPDGDVLLPVYFCAEAEQTAFSVCTIRCTFDGENLTSKSVGNVISSNIKRGLIEPSLAMLDDKYYMTIRAEDERGYFTSSVDGLNWGKLIPWHWDDGEPLVMSTTQQHWVSNGKKLFLVYTRKAACNADAMRWRAPLFIACFDEKRDCLVRNTEQEVLPLIRTDGNTNRLGNFHAVDILPGKSIVSAGSATFKLKDDEIADFFSDTWLAEIQWLSQ